MSKPFNCWEYKKCGREPGGKKADELGICPASTRKSLDGMHRGDNAGRACWIIAGTFCEGKVQGDYAAKMESCTQCDFFQLVQVEEKIDLIEANYLLKAMDIVVRQ